MIGTGLTQLAEIAPRWELFAWLAVANFALAVIWRWQGTTAIERLFSTAGWVSLALLWLVMLPYYTLDARSPVQTILVLVAIPASVWAGVIRWRGREQLFIFSKVGAFAGLIYIPVHTIEFLRRGLIELVAVHTHWLMGLLGYSPGIEAGPVGYMSKFAFDEHTTYIVLACTGIGSIAIFGGAILATRAPLRRRLGAAALIGVTIYGLNLLRNVFVGLATPLGWFDFEPFISIAAAFGIAPWRTSFFAAHTLLAQPGSVIALVLLALLALRLVPELFTLFDEAVYVFTGEELDLRAEFGPMLGDDVVDSSGEAAD